MSDSARSSTGSQTLSRGIRILEILAEVRDPLSIDDTAGRLGVHRSIAYRLVRTLEEHGLVERDPAGRVRLGPRLATLASGIAADLQTEALPELTAIANELGMTCFLAVLDGDQCITLASVEPRHGITSVAQRPGARHSIAVGAPSKAILSALPRGEWPIVATETLAADVATAVARGYATSSDEVIPSVRAVSVPLRLPNGQRPAAIAVAYVASSHDDAALAARLARSAETIREALG